MQNFFRQMGGSMGIASLSTLITRFSAQNYLDLQSKVTALNCSSAWNGLCRRARALDHEAPGRRWALGDSSTVALKGLYGRVMNQVFVLSFEQLCWVIMIVFAFALIPLYLIRLPKEVKAVLGYSLEERGCKKDEDAGAASSR